MVYDKRKRLEIFLKISRIFVILSFTVLFIASMVYLYMDEVTYNLIILLLMAAVIVVILLTGLLVYIVTNAYKTGKINKTLALLVNRFIKLVIPIATVLGELFKMDKNIIRGFFVDINNIVVNSIGPKCECDQALILVPHCLQWAECGYKVTHNPYNCKSCGKCDIAKVLELADRYHIKLCIASGGTMARKAIQENKPKVIISVACNRDLISGILDVDDIPVIAIENSTPQGPCINTQVDSNKVEEAIKQVVRDLKLGVRR
ncbi:MAG: DUF116 domain-containing protein [Firmicutes bacterium]|nr:DUF116 domain-containing protein [Bacillota bacterium]